jgi:glycosyltransferase involved in cell wall biosynthesis
VNAGNFQQLYETIQRLIKDASVGDLLGRAARASARTRYSQDVVLRKYVELFNRLVHQKVDTAKLVPSGNTELSATHS